MQAKPARFLGMSFLTSYGGKKRPAEKGPEKGVCIEQTQAQLCSKLVANDEPGSGNLGGQEADILS